MQFGFRIEKVAEEPDGSLRVVGKATGPDLDLDEQIIDKDFARKALGEWFRDWGNVRQMHSTSLAPAGKAIGLTETPDGFDVETKVVEPGAKALVKAKVYQAYSIGISKPRIVNDAVAKRGRVVDGIVSELSLVDFPANPTCRLTLAKRADDGQVTDVNEVPSEDEMAKLLETTLAKSVDESEGRCGLCGGSGKIRDGHVTCPDCHGSGKLSDVADEDRAAQRRRGELKVEEPAAQKRDFDPAVGGGVDRDKIPAEDFAGKDRSFPIVTPGDVSDAAASVGRAGSDNYSPDELKANIIRIARRKGPKFVEELPKTWRDELGKKVASPAIRELHDAVCGAYPLEAVFAFHPELGKHGVAAAFGPMAQQIVYRLLADETQEDGGDGHNAWAVQKLASSYALLGSLPRVDDPEDILRAARADLEKAVVGRNPTMPVLTPANMTPGAFKRPYMERGHAQDYARPGDHPRIPPSDHVPSASDFNRPLIVSGHESNSPQNTGGGVRPVVTHAEEPDLLKDRAYYRNATKDSAREVMQAMHDHIADVFPDICPMASGTNVDLDTVGPVPATAKVPNKDNSIPHPIAATVSTAGLQPVPDLNAGAEPDLTKASSEAVAAAIEAAVSKVREEMGDQIKTLQADLQKLAASPDPAAPVTRVIGGILPPGTTDQEAPETVEKRRRLEVWQNSGDPQLRLAAEKMLRDLAKTS